MRETRNRSKISVDQILSLTYTDITMKPGGETQDRRTHRSKSRGGTMYLIAGLLFLFILTSAPKAVNAWTADYDPRDNRQDMSSQGKQISSINLLLPISSCPECRKVREELFATNGCYKWENSNPSLISMTDQHGRSLDGGLQGTGVQSIPECIPGVFLEPRTMRETKTLTWITATDKNSGQVLRCQVKVGAIVRLEIQTRYRQFSVNENEMMRVAGYDDEGNIFSSLEGLAFDWEITKGSDVVKRLAMPDTGSRTTHETDLFFLKGVQSGQAEVSVKIVEPGYDQVPEIYVPLTIVDPFIILPARPAYILPVSPFTFELAHLRMEENAKTINIPISLPDARFEWSVTEPIIGAVNNNGKFCSSVTEGPTGIEVIDTTMQNNTAEGSIHVVYPYRLEVKIRDVTNDPKVKAHQNGELWTGQMEEQEESLWEESLFDLTELQEDSEDEHILIEQRDYLIEVFLYEKGNNRIKLTDNLRFTHLGLDERYFKVKWTNPTGSQIIVRTKEITEEKHKVDTVHKLSEIKPTCGNESWRDFKPDRLAQDRDLIITKAVQILHPKDFILLPFLPAAQEQHGNGEIWHISAKGGSGLYSWEVLDESIATVQGSNPAVVQSVKVGTTVLVARDHRNWYNQALIKLEVAVINQLAWIEPQSEIRAAPSEPEEVGLRQQKELPRGEERTLSLVAFDQTGRKFTNCTAVRPSFEVKTDNGYFMHGDPEVAASIRYPTLPPVPKYQQIREYVLNNENFDLLMLRARFDEQRAATLKEDLEEQGPRAGLPKIDADEYWKEELVIFHNNFGICAQHSIEGVTEGLDRLRASFLVHDYANGPGRLLESEFAEIAVYSPLKTTEPRYKPFFSDLYSVSQLGQTFQSFEGFYKEGVIHLQFGNSITWKVLGGTNFWQDQRGQYISEWLQIPLHTESNQRDSTEVIHVRQARERATEFDTEVTCLVPKSSKDLSASHQVILHLDQRSQLTRHLLQPAPHHGQVEVHCEPPRDLKLLWAQENRTAEWLERPYWHLPRSRVVYGERTHYVLVNTEHHVRYLMLDADSQASLNHSSVATRVRSTDEAMAEVRVMSGQPFSYEEAVACGDYDKRYVQFKNVTGTVYLQATSAAYFSSLLNAEPQKEPVRNGGSSGGWWGGVKAAPPSKEDSSDGSELGGDYASCVRGGTAKFTHDHVFGQLKVEVVRNVDVEPKYKSLYIGAGTSIHRLRILNGSGHFSVTLNNTQLAEMQHRDREILLTPKAIGGLEVRVEDLELPGSTDATSEVLISDIARLTLDAPRTLIEVGGDVDLTVTAYDNKDKEFEDDQYALMTFDIVTEMTGLLRTRGGLQTEPIKAQHPRMFLADGKEAGIYQLQAYTYRWPYLLQALSAEKGEALGGDLGDRHTIVSEVLRIEVFPLLEIIPSELLITPNMRYTLQIVGGPQAVSRASQADGSHVDIRFEIAESDREIAKVDRFREVTGLRVGDAALHYEIIQQRTHHHAQLGNLYDVSTQLEPGKVVSQRTVPIRVRLVTDIEIPYAHRRQIYSGSLMRGIAVLKLHEKGKWEYFHHGIAPISYNWNCTDHRVLQLDLPTEEGLATSHGSGGRNLVQRRKDIHHGETKIDKTFYASFNSSAIYATAGQEGEADLQLLLAIEYPALYNDKKNWFSTTASIKVAQKLSISVPQYSDLSSQSTHLYLLPPNTRSKIETNRSTRLRLGYSQQSVFDHSTQTYQYREATSPIIDLVNDEAIRTFDKYGKVTVIVEEGQAFSDQLVMLNVLIADVYTLATMQSYEALSLPLDSSLTLPIHLQNEHAHRFAHNIEGLEVGFLLSHPRVVSVQLDYYNQTLTLEGLGGGDCNIVLFLVERQHIFDVIRVRVSSEVRPKSPVYLHLGGEIEYRVDSTDDQRTSYPAGQQSSSGGSSTGWTSSAPYTLEIDTRAGKAVGLQAGRAEVMLGQHATPASIVHISKVASAQPDPASPLIINTDGGRNSNSGSTAIRVRVKLFLGPKQSEEVMPTVRDEDGVTTLIRQNVDFECQSDNPQFVHARGAVDALEGYFCDINYVGGSAVRGMPRFVKIAVTVSGKSSHGKVLYSERVTEFEVQLASGITVLEPWSKGVHLDRKKRSAEVRILSSSNFKVQYDGPVKGKQEVLDQLDRVPDSNEYILTLRVPEQVQHAFEARMVLESAHAKKIIEVTFTDADVNPLRTDAQAANYYAQQDQGQSARSAQQDSYYRDSDRQPVSWNSYFVMALAVILVIIFILIQCCEIDPAEAWDSIRYGRYRDMQRGRRGSVYPQQQPMRGGGAGPIRDSASYRKQPLNRNSFDSFGNQGSLRRRNPNITDDSIGGRRARGAANLEDFPYRRQNPNRSSYSGHQDAGYT